MSLTCAISGKPPQIPVINRVSGLIYEKSLIVKYLKELHKDPVTGQETTEEDLIQLNTNSFVRPRVSAAASLPSLIKMLQDEYDAVALETYTLRKQLETCRQELSHSLYQHDAACRVIARLTKERDEARNALANLAAGSEKNKTSTEIENKSNNSEHVNMPQDVIEKINSTSEVLQAERKEKKKPADLTTKDKIAYFKEKNNFYSIHSASSAGILCLSLHDQHPNWILTGGVDKKVVLYDIFADSVVHTYQGHTKKVTCCELHPSQDLVISGSADAQVRIFSTSADKLLHVFTSHFSGVTSLSIHPTNDLMASSDSAGSWSFHDLSRQSTYQTSVDPNKSCINCGSIHPDGILYGSGLADSMVRIWDIRTASPVVAFEGHKAIIIVIIIITVYNLVILLSYYTI
ncbi:pre-mRNA-processing factor 19-like [Zophobas morio]|uniref:pre-mRNA-processing factor 19-like n=1 Tax=Zophobas morio TaxID=2755281 RepID=UPI0030828569